MSGLQPPSPADSIGWYLSLYWPAMKKQFKGIVQKYDSDSNHHTVKWDNAPKGSDGVTEVDLTEGELTWLAPPAKVKKSRRASAEAKASMAKGKPGETMKELELRFTGKTTKAVAFQVLKDSGPEGMTLAEIVHESQKAGLRDWSTCKQPKTTINVCVSQDAAFVKISPGRVGLRVNGAKPRDPAEARLAANGGVKKRGRPPKVGERKAQRKPRTEPQHWERKPPIECSLDIYTADNKFVAKAPITVPFNSTIKNLRKLIAANTKGQLKPQFQQIFHDGRNIGNDEEVFLVHAVRPTKFERSLDLKLIISPE